MDQFLIHIQRKQEETGSRGRLTCSEEEDGHSAVVLPLRPVAQRNQAHQKGHQGRGGAAHEQHEGGNLPVCGRERVPKS